MRTLKEIALELLEKYEYAQTSVIWEYSGRIEEEVEDLKKEVAKYKDEINKATM